MKMEGYLFGLTCVVAACSAIVTRLVSQDERLTVAVLALVFFSLYWVLFFYEIIHSDYKRIK